MIKRIFVIFFVLTYLLVFDASFLLAQIQDTTPPDLISLDFNPKVIDATGLAQPQVIAVVTIRDNDGGVGAEGIDFRFLNEDGTRGIGRFGERTISRSEDDLTVTKEITFLPAQFLPPGNYFIDNFSMGDRAGNFKRLSRQEIAEMGFPILLINQGPPPQDTTPPDLISLDFNPKVIDATGLAQPQVIAVVTIRDNDGGVGAEGIDFRFLNEDGTRGIGRFGERTISRSEDDLTVTKEITFLPAQFLPPGNYFIDNFSMGDRAGNFKRLSRQEIAEMGFPIELFNGNTPPGQNIVVGPISGVTLTYVTVVVGGQTIVNPSSSGPTPPSGFKFGNPPTYYSISTTAEFNPPVEVCINYDDTQFKNENNLKLFHFENGQWINITTSLDTINNIICGQVSSFSEFGLFEDITTDHIIDEVKSFNLDPDIEQGLLDKLNSARSAIERNQNKTARNILKAFINLVNAQEGKKITTDQANILRTDAQALINSLGGNLLSTIFKWVLFGWIDKFIDAMLSTKL